MSWVSGKALGALLGAALGIALHSELLVIVFVLIGLGIGHQVDARDERRAAGDEMLFREWQRDPELIPATGNASTPEPESREEIDSQDRSQRAVPLCNLFIAVARADAPVVADEVREIREYFVRVRSFGPAELDRVRLALKDAIAAPPSVEDAAAPCREELSGRERVDYLDALYRVALADGDLNRAERDALKLSGNLLYVSEAEQLAVLHRHLGQALEHYAVLGLTPSATEEEIKSVFRKLAGQHHPDRVVQQGKPAVDEAGEQFRRIKTAYEEIRIRRGF